MQIETISEILQIIEKANQVYNSEADWLLKYDLIFSDSISCNIFNLGLRFDYYDPDSSYEEDVRAYITALNHEKDRLEKVEHIFRKKE